MPQEKNTFEQILAELIQFRTERDWMKYTDPRDLVSGLSVEAAELLELFLWKKPEEIQKLINERGAFYERVSEELADVINYAILVGHAFNFDLTKIIAEKIEKNRKKYPVELVKGKRRNRITGTFE